MLPFTFPRLRYLDVRSGAIVYVTVRLHASQSTLVQFSTFLPLPSCISIYSVIENEPLLKKYRSDLELQLSLPTGNLKKN